MDRRLILAVVLGLIVFIVTPLIFPTPPKPPAADTTAAHRATTPGTTAARPETATAAAPSAPGAPGATSAPARAADTTTAAAAPAAAETTVVATSLTRYAFSSLGASPVSVTLAQYRSLNPRLAGQVELVRPGDRLVDFALVTGSDTLPLDRHAFTPALGKTASGAPELTYTGVIRDAQVAIRYTFVPDSYVVRVAGTVSGAAPGAHLAIHLPNGLRTAEADTVDDQHSLSYVFRPEKGSPKGIPFGKLDPGERRVESEPMRWVAAKNKYFITAVLAPAGGQPFGGLVVTGGPRTTKIATDASATLFDPLRNGQFAFDLYAGPQEWRRLHALGREMEDANPYGGFMQGIVQPFATIVIRLLLWIHDHLKVSYGWVLVIFGVGIRLLLWPLNQSAMRNSLKMQRLQPEMQALQKRYKSDPAKQQQEMMRLYKEHGMSPLSPLMGCLPMLLPWPILIALFFVFRSTIEFRGVPFLWMHDISLKDPYYILPLLMAVSMFVLSWIGQRNMPPAPQAKMLMYVMPAMMLVFFLNLPAGLNLYYAVQNITSLPQQWMIAHERAKSGVPRPATSS